MRKILFAILLAWISSFSIHAQTSGIIEVTDNISVPLEQQLATLFSQLNFADVKTGLLEERGFCPLNPGYFSGEGKTYQKLSAAALNSWKQQYQTRFSQSSQVSSGITGLLPAIKRLDSAVQKYFVPALSASNPAPTNMQTMQLQTASYKKLDSTIAVLAAKNQSVSNVVSVYLSLVSTLLKPYIDSYSPQALQTLLTDDNAASIKALRMLYDGMYNASVDTLHRPLP